jgi:hypothetical protein
MKRYSEEEKRRWVEDWEGSGQSVWAYAKANGLVPMTFKRWTAEGKAEGSFVEILPGAMQETIRSPEILIEKGDIKIHIPLMVNQQELRVVMESLGCGL